MKKILTVIVLFSMAGAFSADIVWRKYKEITNDVFISSTDNLIIEAGTTVRFAPGTGLTIYGQISSNGTETEPVVLAALDRVTTEWDGIVINSMSGNNVFNYTSFNFMTAPVGSGNGGLSIFQSNASLNYCKFINCHGEAGGAIKITGGNVTVQNTYFTLNGSPNGGAIHIYNDSNVPSIVNINSCRFQNNDGWNNGGAIYIKDNPGSSSFMELNITRCLMFDNHSGLGGAVFYQNEGKIDAEISKCRILRNTSDWGSAVYARFQPFVPGSIPPQKFANLLVYKNAGWLQSGVYIDMGLTQNPLDLKFTNATIAFNSILSPQKAERQYTSGIYVKYNGLSPRIENTTIWGNTDNVGICNFWIDAPIPEPANIFWYCDLQNFEGGNNISAPPVFIRPPQNSLLEVFDVDRYDMHEALGSPVVNAGNPGLFDPDGTRLNIGAYGGTAEATKGNYSLVAPVANTDVSVAAGAAMVLDFQGKSGEFLINNISMGQNSQLFLKSAENVNILTKSLTTPPAIHTEFDGYVSIEASRDANTGSLTVAQGLTVSDQALINNANFYNVMLNIDKAVFYSSVTIKDAKFFSEAQTISPYAVNIAETDMVTIENSKFIDYESGICVGLPWSGTTGKGTKVPGKISNNTISFDPDVASKSTKAAKRVGIEVNYANIDIEENEIEGGDEGIVMKNNSSGKITNNTVSFDADIASKKGLFPKIGILLSGNSVSSEISNNVIINEDDSTASVTGIEINTSQATILYNSLGFESVTSGTARTGIKVVSPTNPINIYNNTIYNTLLCFDTSASSVVINITNNIFWGEGSTHTTINNPSNVSFSNNCFIDSTNVSGSSNIYIDPQINAPNSQDFTLDSESPCINAGIVIDGVHVFDAGKAVYYYGTAPDIGSKELYQELTAPSSVTPSVTGTNFNLSWSPVPGFSYYKVYDSNIPYGTFTHVVYHGTSLNCTVPIGTKKFYYVIATTEAPTKEYDTHDAVSENSKTESENNNSGSKKKNVIIRNNSDR
jgi:parallel beta-helix repeat protein